MREMRRLVGDECMIGGGFFGPFTMAAQMLGVEDFMVEMIAGEEEDVLYAVDFAAEIVIAYLEDLVEAGLDLITVPPITSIMGHAAAHPEVMISVPISRYASTSSCAPASGRSSREAIVRPCRAAIHICPFRTANGGRSVFSK